MICTLLVDNRDLPAGFRVRHSMHLRCDGCKRRFPREDVPTDGSDWMTQFERLVIMSKHGLVERTEGRMRRDYCKKCIAKMEKKS